MSLNLTKEDYDQLSLGDIVIVQIDRLKETDYSKNGKVDAILSSDEELLAYVPANEYSIYKNYVTVQPEEAKGLIFKAEVIDKKEEEGLPILVLSIRRVTQERYRGVLEEVKDADFIVAPIVGFNRAGALLNYKGLPLLMTHASFVNGNRNVQISDILSVGDMVDVKFDRLRKKGREVRVTPLIKLPKPAWQREVDWNQLTVDHTVTGIVRRVTPRLIYIDVGRDKDGRRVGGSAYHPVDGYLDSLCQEGVEVYVKVYQVHDNGYMYMNIIDVVYDPVYDNKIHYYQEVEKFYAES